MNEKVLHGDIAKNMVFLSNHHNMTKDDYEFRGAVTGILQDVLVCLIIGDLPHAKKGNSPHAFDRYDID